MHIQGGNGVMTRSGGCALFF